jgi:molecular chaperone IbpA
MTQFTLHTIDLPTFANQIHRHTIGFDNLFSELNRNFANSKSDNYPPHNVIRLDDQHHVIEIAVAGFAESEIDVELKDSVLTVRGEQAKKETEVEYLHKGLSTRNFERTFRLADNTEVKGATIKNGILVIALEHIVPEEQKAKKIAITFAK